MRGRSPLHSNRPCACKALKTTCVCGSALPGWSLQSSILYLLSGLQGMPKLALATPNADFVPEKVFYYRYTVAPRLYYFLPPLLATVLMFAGFAAWRLVRRCCRCWCHWCCVTTTQARNVLYPDEPLDLRSHSEKRVQ